MKTKLVMVAAFAFAAFVSSCKKDLSEVSPSSSSQRISAFSHEDTLGGNDCNPVVAPFFAGQTIDAGTVTVTNDSSYIYVTFSTSNGWVFGQTHLYVGTREGLPVTKKGNPKIGNFPYKTSHDSNTDYYTYAIPFSNFSTGDCIVIAAHAEVHLLDTNGTIIQSETAWGGDEEITSGGSWARLFNYCICDDTNEGGGGGMEG